ncbi:UNVERIFIED_CONTAM: hypothetical protein Slati_2540500 [Sesamum latifolium]|uniref:Uncharacterized protein n=1 Tax=Sesamum latifolium TaxID=2727402 RepID=A0AAW2WFH9_9LAMI
MREMLQRVGRVFVFGNGWGATVCHQLVRHHSLDEGNALSFIFRGFSDLTLDVLEAFLKALEVGEPLWRYFLRS